MTTERIDPARYRVYNHTSTQLASAAVELLSEIDGEAGEFALNALHIEAAVLADPSQTIVGLGTTSPEVDGQGHLLKYTIYPNGADISGADPLADASVQEFANRLDTLAEKYR